MSINALNRAEVAQALRVARADIARTEAEARAARAEAQEEPEAEAPAALEAAPRIITLVDLEAALRAIAPAEPAAEAPAEPAAALRAIALLIIEGLTTTAAMATTGAQALTTSLILTALLSGVLKSAAILTEMAAPVPTIIKVGAIQIEVATQLKQTLILAAKKAVQILATAADLTEAITAATVSPLLQVATSVAILKLAANLVVEVEAVRATNAVRAEAAQAIEVERAVIDAERAVIDAEVAQRKEMRPVQINTVLRTAALLVVFVWVITRHWAVCV